MTNEKYVKASYIKEQISHFNMAISSVENARSIEFYSKDSSDKYGHNSTWRYDTTEIFELMKKGIIKELQSKISELNKEFENI